MSQPLHKWCVPFQVGRVVGWMRTVIFRIVLMISPLDRDLSLGDFSICDLIVDWWSFEGFTSSDLNPSLVHWKNGLLWCSWFVHVPETCSYLVMQSPHPVGWFVVGWRVELVCCQICVEQFHCCLSSVSTVWRGEWSVSTFVCKLHLWSVPGLPDYGMFDSYWKAQRDDPLLVRYVRAINSWRTIFG